MKTTVDAAVIGAGITGSAIAFALAREGAAVALIERDAEPAPGPTRRSGACTRQFYGDPRLSALSRESLDLAWNRWPDYTGLKDPEAAHLRCGTLVVAPPASPRGLPILHLPPGADAVELFAANLRKAGVTAFEVLDGRDLQKRFPALRLSGVRGLWERESGCMQEPAAAARDLCRAAKREGAELLFGCPVTGVSRSRGGWLVTVPRGEIWCARVVLAAGAWTAALLPVRLRRHALRVVRPRIAYLGAPSSPSPVVADAALGAYFRPRGGGLFAANLAEEKDVLRRPDDLDPRSGRYPHVERAARKRFRSLAAAPVLGAAAIYDVNVLDGNPVVDRLAPGLFCAWLFSGHGFKFAPAIADPLAQAVLDDVAPLGLPFPSDR